MAKLENHLGPKLKLTRQARAGRQSKGGSRGQRRTNSRELRVIENIECFGAKLQFHSLFAVEVNILNQRHVGLVASKQTCERARRIAISSRQRRSERTRVEDEWQS